MSTRSSVVSPACGGVSAGACASGSPVHPLMPPVGIVELALDVLSPLLARYAERVDAILVHPAHQDDVRNVRDVPPPVAPLRGRRGPVVRSSWRSRSAGRN